MIPTGNGPRLVDGLRKVLGSSHSGRPRPERLKLSPASVVEVMGRAEPGEIGIMELENGGRRSKHISFNGIPIVLSLKYSHLPHRLLMGQVKNGSNIKEC